MSLGEFVRIAVRCCERVVFWPRWRSCPSLSFGANRLSELALRRWQVSRLGPKDGERND